MGAHAGLHEASRRVDCNVADDVAIVPGTACGWIGNDARRAARSSVADEIDASACRASSIRIEDRAVSCGVAVGI